MEAHLISSAYLSGDYLLDFPSSKLIIYELITLHIKLDPQPPLVHTRISYRYLIFAVQWNKGRHTFFPAGTKSFSANT